MSSDLGFVESDQVIKTVTVPQSVNFDLSEFSELFSEGMGKLNDFKANISLKEGHEVKYFNPRPVQLAQRETD